MLTPSSAKLSSVKEEVCVYVDGAEKSSTGAHASWSISDLISYQAPRRNHVKWK
ncbi:hypothetical protein C8Q74DRAFT_1276390, partial [Fomes fomentarius]